MLIDDIESSSAPVELADVPTSETTQAAAAAAEETKNSASADAEQEEGEALETDGDSETPNEQPNDGKKKGGFQKRIDKLTAKATAAEARAAELERLLADKTAAKPGEKPAAPAAAQDGKPLAASFDSYEEYTEALTDWKLDQRAQAETAKAAQQAQQAQQQELGKKWNAGVETLREKYDDFDDIIEAEVSVTPAMQQAVLESEIGPELAYYLGKHPEEAARIAALSPASTARELGKIEAKLTVETAAPNKKPQPSTKAPAPISPVSNRSTATVGKSPDEMDYDEYKAHRNKR